MKAWLVMVLAAAFCAGVPDTREPQTIGALHQVQDWQHERGERLPASLTNGVSRIAWREGRADVIAQHLRCPVWVRVGRSACGQSRTDGSLYPQLCGARRLSRRIDL